MEINLLNMLCSGAGAQAALPAGEGAQTGLFEGLLAAAFLDAPGAEGVEAAGASSVKAEAEEAQSEAADAAEAVPDEAAALFQSVTVQAGVPAARAEAPEEQTASEDATAEAEIVAGQGAPETAAVAFNYQPAPVEALQGGASSREAISAVSAPAPAVPAYETDEAASAGDKSAEAATAEDKQTGVELAAEKTVDAPERAKAQEALLNVLNGKSEAPVAERPAAEAGLAEGSAAAAPAQAVRTEAAPEKEEPRPESRPEPRPEPRGDSTQRPSKGEAEVQLARYESGGESSGHGQRDSRSEGADVAAPIAAVSAEEAPVEVDATAAAPEGIDGAANGTVAAPQFVKALDAAQANAPAPAQRVHAEVAEKLDSGVSLAIDKGGEARIKLNPESLGELTIRLNVENDSVRAEITVESLEVKKIIEGDSRMLREALGSHGLTLDKCVVEVSGSHSMNLDRNLSEGPYRDGSRWSRQWDDGRGSGSDFGREEHGRQHERKDNGRIDIFI